MSKLTLKRRTYGPIGQRGQRLHLEIRVGQSAVRAREFAACIHSPRNVTVTGRGSLLLQCGTGTNPRAAISSALRKYAVTVGKRKGAFAGFGALSRDEIFAAARAAEAKLAQIARTRRPTQAETDEAQRAYRAAKNLTEKSKRRK